VTGGTARRGPGIGAQLAIVTGVLLLLIGVYLVVRHGR
jgi:hypothetical protein